jgi:hypothetical protein
MNLTTLGKMLMMVAPLAVAGCSKFDVENKPPVADAQLLVNGVPADPAEPIAFMGSPVSITLDGSGSSDEDGTIVKSLWLQTDVSNAVRYGLGDAGALGPFMGDPMAVASPQLSLGEGTYQYSLWVTDDEDAISAPATIEFTIEMPTSYMPDATCKMNYPSGNPECADCVCTPTAMMGCLDDYTACYMNADPAFVMLCKAIVDCAAAKGCKGSMCFTPELCQTEITAGVTYMGGTDCMGDPAVNPCAAASKLGQCAGSMGASNCLNACN